MKNLRAWCYGTITAVMALSIVSRIAYIWLNEAEFREDPLKKCLNWRFTFMEIHFIHAYKLLWPLAIILVVLSFCLTHDLITGLLRVYTTDIEKGNRLGLTSVYLKEVLARWTLSYFLFLGFYHGFARISGTGEADFDPSGHYACYIVEQANHASYYLFLAKATQSAQQENKIMQEILGKLELASLVIFAMF